MKETVDKDVMIKLLQSLVREIKKEKNPFITQLASAGYETARGVCIQIVKNKIKKLKGK